MCVNIGTKYGKDDIHKDKDDIHKEFWEKLKDNFKGCVKEFFDGSTCNEKIIFFCGKCTFKEGYDRTYILDKKIWPKEDKKI